MRLRFLIASSACLAGLLVAAGCGGGPSSSLSVQPSLSSGASPNAASLQKHSIWSVVSTPNINPGQITNDALNGIRGLSPQDVWAVGSYCCAPGSQQNFTSLIEHWDGGAWTIVPGPTDEPANSQLRAVAPVSSNDVWAVGATGSSSDEVLIEHWDGTVWSVAPSPKVVSPLGLYGVVAVSANDVWAVGGMQSSSGLDEPLAEHWDGKQWTIVPSPRSNGGFQTLTSVSANNSNDVWAVGFFDTPNPNALTLHWNGKRWAGVRAAGRFEASDFRSVAAVSPNDAWAVGSQTNPLSGYDAQLTLIEHWNGARWKVVASPNMGPSGFTNWLFGVAALSSEDVWAVGYWTPSGDGGPRSLFEKWDGKAWTTQPGPPPLESKKKNPQGGNELYGGITSLGAGQLWAAGSQTAPKGECCTRTLAVRGQQ